MIGQSVRRLEDRRLITGEGRYVDDMASAGMLHAVFVRSIEAHAAIRSGFLDDSYSGDATLHTASSEGGTIPAAAAVASAVEHALADHGAVVSHYPITSEWVHEAIHGGVS